MKYQLKTSNRMRRVALASSVFAVMLALQPLLDQEVDFKRKDQVARYVVRICFAVVMALLGKYRSTVSSADGEPNKK
ncbi:MAG: hypothetical protein ACJ75B_13275 [Flavisolibacter sp.]